MFMLNSHNPVPRIPRSTPQMYFPGKLAAKCMYCGDEYLIPNEMAVDVFSYPQHRPFICPMCRFILNASEEAIEAENGMNDLDDDPTDNYYVMNEMEEKNDDRYDEKFESDEASDDEHEDLCRLLKTACQGGGSKGSGNGCIQDEADSPYLILDIVLIRAMIPLK